MFILQHDDASVLTLKDLRDFLNEDCANLPDDTPIMLNAEIKDEPIVPCIQVLADEESVELYNF